MAVRVIFFSFACVHDRLTVFSFTCRYYIRESKSSKRWLLLLEGEQELRYTPCRRPSVISIPPSFDVCLGGWYCLSKHTCDYRMKTNRALMSSSPWPRTRKGTKYRFPSFFLLNFPATLKEENQQWKNTQARIIYLNVRQLGSYAPGFCIFRKHYHQCEPSPFDRNRNSVS